MSKKIKKRVEQKVAGIIKDMAASSARNAAGKKLIYMVYEPEVPEAVKEFIKKEKK